MELHTMSAYDVGKIVGYVIAFPLAIIVWRVIRAYQVPPITDDSDNVTKSGFWYFMGHGDGQNDAQD